MQRVLSKYTYAEFDHFRTASARAVLDEYAQQRSGAGALSLTAVHVQRLEAADEKLREARLRMRRMEEDEAARARQAAWAAQRAEHEGRQRVVEARSRLEVEELQRKHELEVEANRQHQELALKAKKAELLRTEEGQMVEDMALVYEYKGKKLEVDKLVAQLNDKQTRDLLRTILSHQSGQNSVLRAIVSNQIGITLTDETNTAEGIRRLVEAPQPDVPQPISASDTQRDLLDATGQ